MQSAKRLRGSPTQPPLWACLATWAVLTALQYELIPIFRYAWGFNLWGYLPPWIGGLLAALSLCVCFSRVREILAHTGDAVVAQFARLPAATLRGGVLLLLAVALLWRLRERVYPADSSILLGILAPGGRWFQFPEIGATFFMHGALVLGKLLEIRPGLLGQLSICVFGGFALLLTLRLARRLEPGRGRAGTIAMLILSGGVVRVFAGHIEVYAAQLVTVIAYLWLALSYLEGRSSWTAPCLVLGLAIWVHAAAILLLPSLALLPFIASPELPVRDRLKRVAEGGLLAAIPCVAFISALALFRGAEDLPLSWHRAVEVLGQSSDPDAVRWWVRGWGGAPSIGTDVVFLSRAQLKLLVNSFFVLFPFALPCLLCLAIRSPRSLLATPQARFLVATSVPTIAYALVLRPFWGPFDWDLFSITGICLAALAAHLLAVGFERPSFRQLAVWLIAFNLLFVGLPFLLTGFGKCRDAGPFAPGYFGFHIKRPGQPPPEKLAPWL